MNRKAKMRYGAAAAVICIALIFCAVQWAGRRLPDKETCVAEALEYLSEQERLLADADDIPAVVDPDTGRFVEVHMNDSTSMDRMKDFIQGTVEVRLVEEAAELEPPRIDVGDRMWGNHQKLYLQKRGRLVEYTLGERAALDLLLYATCWGTMYPEVRSAYVSEAVAFLRENVTFERSDSITYFENGNVETLDIRTPETLDLLIGCIGRCENIVDLTGHDLEPMFIPITVNGAECAAYDSFFFTTKTGQFLQFCFTEEDAGAVRAYLLSLKK